MKTVIDYLQARGALEQKSSEDIGKFLEKPRPFYIGFDPTADSLHIGNLLGIVIAKALQNEGHHPYILLGGATARIGDPSGKLVEREKIAEDVVEKNTAAVQEFLEKILQSSSKNAPIILNNYDWFSSLTAIDFLRDIGRHFRLGNMLAKASVAARLSSPEGMSFCEFSYQLLQGFDFLHLFSEKGVSLQIGGADQWGNMVAGIDLIRKKRGKAAYAFTFPLLTDSTGKKLGKTESGAVWLDAKKISPYRFYQYLFHTSDRDVIHLLKMLTFLPLEEITSLEKEMTLSSYHPNKAQTLLAKEVTKFLHGQAGLKAALQVTQTARPGGKANLSKEDLAEIAKDMPSISVPYIAKEKFSDIALKAGLVSSKSEATRLVKGGGAYINNKRIEDPQYIFSEEDLIGGAFVLLSSGKKRRVLVRIEPS